MTRPVRIEPDRGDTDQLIGADRVLFGSDWPHPAGVAEPVDFLADVAELAPDDRRRVMSENLRELLGHPR